MSFGFQQPLRTGSGGFSPLLIRHPTDGPYGAPSQVMQTMFPDGVLK
jgi:hypothetical protein